MKMTKMLTHRDLVRGAANVGVVSATAGATALATQPAPDPVKDLWERRETLFDPAFAADWRAGQIWSGLPDWVQNDVCDVAPSDGVFPAYHVRSRGEIERHMRLRVKRAAWTHRTNDEEYLDMTNFYEKALQCWDQIQHSKTEMLEASGYTATKAEAEAIFAEIDAIADQIANGQPTSLAGLAAQVRILGEMAGIYNDDAKNLAFRIADRLDGPSPLDV